MSSTHQKLQILLLLVIYYSCSSIHTSADGGRTIRCLPDQSYALLRLKRSFHNPNLSSWQVGTDCCHWEGVTCDTVSGQVISLDLSDRNLQSTGDLNPALFNLTSLVNLCLAGNYFWTASLPTVGFERLTELINLNLSWTNLFGQIPVGIARLKKLQTLDLSYSYDLYFRQPSFQTVVGNLSNLRKLYLSGVNLSGDGNTWSNSLADSVPRLQYLDLSFCRLSGPIHHSFSGLHSLEEITLAGNKISGEVPEFFADFSSLTALDLSGNDFFGQIPVGIVRLKKLQTLDLSYNDGLYFRQPSFQTVVGNLSNLRGLYLSGVDLSGDGNIWSNSLADSVPRLQYLDLSGCGLSGPIHHSFSGLHSLKYISLEGNQISGEVPGFFADFSSLTALDLSGNDFFGQIPVGIFHLKKLQTLDLSYNDGLHFRQPSFQTVVGNLSNLRGLYLSGVDLSGDGNIWSNSLADSVPRLQYLDLSGCGLSGPIHHSFSGLHSLKYISLEGNQISGEVPGFFADFSSLTALDLSGNDFFGQIPVGIFHLKKLQTLDLSYNDGLHFRQPSFQTVVGNLSNLRGLYLSGVDLSGDGNIWSNSLADSVPRLQYLDLSGCGLSGPIHHSFSGLHSLKYISLEGNQISGEVPGFFADFSSLTALDLSGNDFFGQIPVGIFHLKKLLTLDLSSNYDLYFRQPSFQTAVGNLSNLRELYLSGVDLSGDGNIWSNSLADSVPRLQYLDLSGCGLSGPIHHSFSGLHSLEEITLTANKISGEVPEFFADFSSLTALDLSYNDFEGKFPTKIFQLKSLRSIDVSWNTRLSGKLANFPVENNLNQLYLQYTNFSGALSTTFANLKFLKYFGLSMVETANDTTSLISTLPGLQGLAFYGSGLEKPNFSWIGNMKRLVYLELQYYNFSRSIHTWIGNLTSLKTLRLHSCSLYERIPTWIGNLTQLIDLDISFNNLHGGVPKCLFTLPNLGSLELGWNQLSGHIEDISAPLSSSIYYIDLRSNQLSGHIPKSFFQLTNIQLIMLDSNKLTGTVELSLLSGLKYLSTLSLSDNMLSVIDGESHYPFPSLRNIERISLASCNLTKIPSMLRYQDKMSFVDLSNNKINGVIPCWMWENWKDSLGYFNLSHNMFTSLERCTSLIRMTGLTTLDFSSNGLEGNLLIPLISNTSRRVLLDYSNNSFSTIIPGFDIYLNSSIYLNLSKNKLNGPIPTSICGANYEILDLSHNNLTGLVPSCLIQGGNLKMLKLRENQLHGVLPGNIGEGCMLQTIDLNNNQIEGKVPRSLANCRSLEVLDVGNNHIVDSFPTWLGTVSNLRVLILRSNEFYGSIGHTKSDATDKYFSGLQIIDLASNNFSGSLHPKWFEKLETMMVNSTSEGDILALQETRIWPDELYQDSMIVTFKGMDLMFTKILTTFKVIDFSNNALIGTIPESIGRLIAIHGLNMSHNAFTGGIPSKLGALAQLESLDLSWNQLSGPIPQELTSLTYLASLNLSYNNLTGMVPQEAQFLSFSNSSFEGNVGLCGRPLSKQCNSSGTGTPSSSTSSQDSVGTILLFVFVGSGFGIGFAVAFVLSMVYRAKRWNCNNFPFHE